MLIRVRSFIPTREGIGGPNRLAEAVIGLVLGRYRFENEPQKQDEFHDGNGEGTVVPAQDFQVYGIVKL
jgi:hypothetical protein